MFMSSVWLLILLLKDLQSLFASVRYTSVDYSTFFSWAAFSFFFFWYCLAHLFAGCAKMLIWANNKDILCFLANPLCVIVLFSDICPLCTFSCCVVIFYYNVAIFLVLSDSHSHTSRRKMIICCARCGFMYTMDIVGWPFRVYICRCFQASRQHVYVCMFVCLAGKWKNLENYAMSYDSVIMLQVLSSKNNC